MSEVACKRYRSLTGRRRYPPACTRCSLELVTRQRLTQGLFKLTLSRSANVMSAKPSPLRRTSDRGRHLRKTQGLDALLVLESIFDCTRTQGSILVSSKISSMLMPKRKASRRTTEIAIGTRHSQFANQIGPIGIRGSQSTFGSRPLTPLPDAQGFSAGIPEVRPMAILADDFICVVSARIRRWEFSRRKRGNLVTT